MVLTVIALSMSGKESVTMTTTHSFLNVHIAIMYWPFYDDMAGFFQSKFHRYLLKDELLQLTLLKRNIQNFTYLYIHALSKYSEVHAAVLHTRSLLQGGATKGPWNKLNIESISF